eukprot:10241954-Alexandrium_andersonii.AAC.1
MAAPALGLRSSGSGWRSSGASSSLQRGIAELSLRLQLRLWIAPRGTEAPPQKVGRPRPVAEFSPGF